MGSLEVKMDQRPYLRWGRVQSAPVKLISVINCLQSSETVGERQTWTTQLLVRRPLHHGGRRGPKVSARSCEEALRVLDLQPLHS